MDTNMRRVHFNQTTGRWSVLSAGLRGKIAHLCDFCTLKPTCAASRRIDKILEEFGLAAPIAECPTFRPALVFRSDEGLDHKFNTFRLGAAWAGRVKIGGVVTLVGIDNKVIGEAEVTAIHLGTYTDMAHKHAEMNHTMLAQNPKKAPDLLFKVMVRSYGSTFMTPDRQVSVIYMRRLYDEAGAQA